VSSPLERPLARRRPQHSLRGLLLRVATVTAVVGVVALVVSRIDFRHDLHRMRVRVLSGVADGNYHAVVAGLAEAAARRQGTIDNLVTAGSAENVKRLADAARSCEAEFGLAQDGTRWLPGVQLVGRLAKPESVLFLGPNADAIHDFSDLHGLRLGIGPQGSGTEAVSRAIFALPELATLGVTLANHAVDEELAMASRGELDLAVVVTDADAPLVEEWVGRRGLQIASFASVRAVARRLRHIRTGHVGAGDYDAVRVLPKADKIVMKVETVLLGNGCAGRVATMDLLATVAEKHPDFLRHNRDTPNLTGLPLAPAAADYFANEGPHAADEYLPWLVDVMPPANWVYVVTAISVIFNAMGAGHRFRLWRIDAARVRLEGDLAHIFPPATTLGDIQRTPPDDSQSRPETLAEVDRVVKGLEDLAARSRRYSLSMLVPMGQEMAYRYQEGVIYETLAVLRDFRRRCAAPGSTTPAA